MAFDWLLFKLAGLSQNEIQDRFEAISANDSSSDSPNKSVIIEISNMAEICHKSS